MSKPEQGYEVETHNDEKVHEMADGVNDGDCVMSLTCLKYCCNISFSRTVET